MPPVAAAAPGGDDGHAEPSCIDPGPGPGPDGVAEPIGVVGHQDGRRRGVDRAVGGRPLQVELGAGRAEDGRHGVEQGADLGVAVALALHRLGVQPHRDVVDEDPAIDLAQVDDVLAAVDEGVQGSDDVVAVHPQVQGEVVARARRDAGEGQSVFGGRGGHDRLGAVPTRRGDPVRARGDGVVHKLLEIVAFVQLHRPDPTLGGLPGQSDLGRLSATGPRVDEQHRLPGWLGDGQPHVDAERDPRGGVPDGHPDHQTHEVGPAVVAEQQGHDSEQGEHRDGDPDDAEGPPADHPEPRRHDRDHDAGEYPEPAGEPDDRHRHREQHGRHTGHQRHGRGDPLGAGHGRGGRIAHDCPFLSPVRSPRLEDCRTPRVTHVIPWR